MNSYDIAWTGTQKEDTRVFAHENMKPVSSGLYLPGSNQRCVKRGMDMGVLVPGQTHLYAAERDPATNTKIKRFLQRRGFDYTMTPHLHHLKIDGNLDLSFIDLLGCLIERDTKWFASGVVPHLSENSRAMFTVRYAWRTATWLPSMQKAIELCYKKEYVHLCESMRIWNKPYITVQVFLLCSALSEFRFNLELVRYRDRVNTMYAIRFDQLRRTNPGEYPAFADIITTTARRKPMARKTAAQKKRSDAAKRANETRGADGRRAVGIKAAQTRVENELFAKRSAAAKKAWATRRGL